MQNFSLKSFSYLNVLGFGRVFSDAWECLFAYPKPGKTSKKRIKPHQAIGVGSAIQLINYVGLILPFF